MWPSFFFYLAVPILPRTAMTNWRGHIRNEVWALLTELVLCLRYKHEHERCPCVIPTSEWIGTDVSHANLGWLSSSYTLYDKFCRRLVFWSFKARKNELHPSKVGWFQAKLCTNEQCLLLKIILTGSGYTNDQLLFPTIFSNRCHHNCVPAGYMSYVIFIHYQPMIKR